MGTGTPLPLSPYEMQLARDSIQHEFQNLTAAFQVTSWPNQNYNCIAWAADDFTQWWWPDADGESFWPAGVPRLERLDAFITAFETIGYEPCATHEIEPGYEKVAIYTLGDSPKHMAKQLPSGAWSSKLGEWWDIGHNLLEEVRVAHYGSPRQILRRRTLSLATIPTHT